MVYPCCDYKEDIEPDEDWYVGEIDGKAYDEHNIPLWKQVNGQIVKRTQEEIESDLAELPEPEPTELDFLRSDVDFLLMMIEGDTL